jgi:hypothetical protein
MDVYGCILCFNQGSHYIISYRDTTPSVMAKSDRNVGWVLRQDGEIDQRYTMPQVTNTDGSRDMRYNLFQPAVFGPSESLTNGHSQYYQPNSAPYNPGR